MIDDWYIKNLPKIKVCAIFHSRAIRKSVSPKFIDGDAMLVPFQGHLISN